MAEQAPTEADYRYLLALRTELRRFLRWSEEQAVANGVTPAQHQLMLAIRGHGETTGPPTIGDLAGYLLLRHNSVVGLVDRAESAGLVRRERDPFDHRVVRVRLTPSGARRIEQMSAMHLEALGRMKQTVRAAREGLQGAAAGEGLARTAADG